MTFSWPKFVRFVPTFMVIPANAILTNLFVFYITAEHKSIYIVKTFVNYNFLHVC